MSDSNDAQTAPPARVTPRRRIDPERLVHAEEMWAALWPPRRIERELMKRWGVKRRQAAHYLALARKRLRPPAAGDPDGDIDRRARIEAGMLEAASIARAQGDADVLSKCLQRLAELQGLAAPQKFVFEARGVRIYMPPEEGSEKK